MLSKSQARTLFLGGTTLFSTIFLLLTYDSIKRVPKQTKEQNLSKEVVMGKKIWEENNCMGCHTLFGEGAYYAPELTKVVERRGEAWIKVFLKDPQAMFPGERKMVQYDFSEKEIQHVIAFLEWCGKVDLNGFPADPPLKSVSMSAAPVVAQTNQIAGNDVEAFRPEVFDQLCTACHQYHGKGGVVGPSLDNISSKMSSDELRLWLKDPASIKPESKMPKLPLSDEQIQLLTQFLIPEVNPSKGDDL